MASTWPIMKQLILIDILLTGAIIVILLMEIWVSFQMLKAS